MATQKVPFETVNAVLLADGEWHTVVRGFNPKAYLDDASKTVYASFSTTDDLVESEIILPPVLDLGYEDAR